MSWACDSFYASLVNWIGWAICGAQWPGIKSMAARFAGMTVLLACVVAFHMVFSACWPLFEVLGWVITLALGLLRWAATCGQRRAMRRGGKKCALELY